MGILKTAAALLARFLLCFTLIACLWIVSISYRIGPFEYDGRLIAGYPGLALADLGFADSNSLFLAAALALVVGLTGLYRSGRISTVIMVLVAVAIIARVDLLWGALGAVDEYKGVPAYALRTALASVLICPLAWLFPAKPEADNRTLLLCWGALLVTAFLVRAHMFGAVTMIGPYYLQAVIPCLLVPELVRQAWRLRRALSLAD